MRPLPLLLIALLSLSLLSVVSIALLSASPDWVGQLCHPLLIMATCGATLTRLKREGTSCVVGAASLVFVLAGPVVFAAAWSLGFEQESTFKLGGCALLACAVGWLLYWVSLGEEEDLYRVI